jgi:hypothetical protein
MRHVPTDLTAGLWNRTKMPIIKAQGLGCRGIAAEIKPIEPVRVMPERKSSKQ